MDFDNLTRAELAAARAKCDESLMFFTRFWFRVLRGQKFIVNDHHFVIAEALKKVENYEIELLNINIPPRFSKTELAAVNFIARGIGMNPTSNWLYITASDELRAQTSVSIRDIVQHPYFRIMYDVELKQDQNGKNLWRTSKGGGLKTATIFGQITGFGAGQMIQHDTELDDYMRTFEGCVVLDDINKIDDSGQENATNEKVSRVLMNTVLSRRNSKDTPIINIQQRAGSSDATAIFEDYYKGSEKAVFLVMPVIKDGVPLWEWKLGLDEIEQLRTNPLTFDTFETQYMQNPVPKEGLLLPASELHYDDLTNINPSSFAYRFAVGDPADTGGDKFAVPFAFVQIANQGIAVYIPDAICNTLGIMTNTPLIVQRCKKMAIEDIFIEKNGVGLGAVVDLHDKLPSFTTLIPFNTDSTDNKESRIINNYEFIRRYFIFNSVQSGDYKTFMSDLTSYVKGGTNKHKKDAIDVLCRVAEIIKIKYFEDIYS
jgi:hypothetical protein